MVWLKMITVLYTQELHKIDFIFSPYPLDSLQVLASLRVYLEEGEAAGKRERKLVCQCRNAVYSFADNVATIVPSVCRLQ